MRYHCIATDNYKGILEFPHKLAVEYGLFPTSNTRDLYKCIDNLVDAGFVEKLGSGRYKKTIYRIVDFNKTKVASVKSPHESKVKPLPYIEREVVNG